MTPIPRQRQRGAILIVGLMLLIVVTLAAVSAIRMTNMQQIMAGGMQEKVEVFQVAESLIRDMVNQINLGDPLAAGEEHPLVDSVLEGVAGTNVWPESEVSPSTLMPDADANSVAELQYLSQRVAPGYSFGVGSSGTFVAFDYEIVSNVTMNPGNSSALHRQGVRKVGPQ